MKVLLQILILSLIIGCNQNRSTAKKNFETKIDTVSYKYDGFNHHRDLHLLSNNKFILRESSASCFGDYKIYNHSGNYKETDTSIVLNPKQVEIKTYFMFPEIDTTYKLTYSDSLTIKTKYKKFKWNSKQYLFSEQIDSIVYPEFQNDYRTFADSYNEGREPDESGDYLTRKISDFDSLFKPLNIGEIPKKYREYFLIKPVSAQIIYRKKITAYDEFLEENTFKWRIAINKGYNHGLRKGMKLSTENFRFFFYLDSIEPNKSFGNSFINYLEEEDKDSDDDYKIGTEVRTQWEN